LPSDTLREIAASFVSFLANPPHVLSVVWRKIPGSLWVTYASSFQLGVETIGRAAQQSEPSGSLPTQGPQCSDQANFGLTLEVPFDFAFETSISDH
jgi:hypothetical protein